MSHIKKDSFHELTHGDVPVLVDFHAEWCGPCKAMAPTLRQLAERAGNGLRIIKVDVDKSRAAATKYQIQNVPTLILFHKGKVIWRKSGAQSLTTLEGLIKPHVTKA